MVFSAGYYADEAADSPEMLDVALDKPSYQAGETARVKIASRMAGRALIAVMSSGLASTQEVDLPAGGGEVPIRVSDDWNPGAYVTVMLYRPMDEKAKRMPGRALGLRWLAVDQAPRMLNVSLEAPEKVKSGAMLTVPIKVAGLAAGEEARITVAATDVGILNLTRFEAPKPQDWFFGQRRLGTEIRDVYGRLIDGMRAERGKLRSGGDGSAGGMSMQGSPPVEATLALFSGIVKVGADGTAQVEFQLPDFNGTVRLAAVAWSGDKVGSASQGRARARSCRAHGVGAALPDAGRPGAAGAGGPQRRRPGGRLRRHGHLRVRAGQPVAAGLRARRVALNAGERKREAFQLKPGEVGLTTLAVRVTGPNGIDVRRTPHLRREGAGGRHPAPDGQLAGGQGRQDHRSRATSSTT